MSTFGNDIRDALLHLAIPEKFKEGNKVVEIIKEASKGAPITNDWFCLQTFVANYAIMPYLRMDFKIAYHDQIVQYLDAAKSRMDIISVTIVKSKKRFHIDLKLPRNLDVFNEKVGKYISLAFSMAALNMQREYFLGHFIVLMGWWDVGIKFKCNVDAQKVKTFLLYLNKMHPGVVAKLYGNTIELARNAAIIPLAEPDNAQLNISCFEMCEHHKEYLAALRQK